MPSIRITTGSRLHFGLLAPFAAAGPRYGGCGLMIEEPGLRLAFEPAERWEFEGPHSERIQKLVAELARPGKLEEMKPHRLTVGRAAAQHVGLGTGTQLSLAVAQGLALASGRPPLTVGELARLTGRGKRSGIGLHGFALGGFLYDGGRNPGEETPRLEERLQFPAEWRFLLAVPDSEKGMAGSAEAQLFAKHAKPRQHLEERLAALASDELLPAIRARRFEDFAAALFEYNRLAGEFYREAQGGAYSSAWLTNQVEKLRTQGLSAVGQSSWGPTLFVACGSDGEAEALRGRLRLDADFAERELLVTAPRNEGAKCAAAD